MHSCVNMVGMSAHAHFGVAAGRTIFLCRRGRLGRRLQTISRIAKTGVFSFVCGMLKLAAHMHAEANLVCAYVKMCTACHLCRKSRTRCKPAGSHVHLYENRGVFGYKANGPHLQASEQFTRTCTLVLAGMRMHMRVDVNERMQLRRLCAQYTLARWRVCRTHERMFGPPRCP